jgi:hypothetical protein
MGYNVAQLVPNFKFGATAATETPPADPKKFQNHHGMERRLFWPLASSAVALGPKSSQVR